MKLSTLIPALILACGGLVSRWLLSFAPERISADLAQPIVVTTAWGNYGALLCAVLFVTLGAVFLAYPHLLRGNVTLRESLLACVLSLIAGFIWLPLFSSDVYAYAAYGEMNRIGLNPYVHLTHHLADPVVAAAQWQWSGAFPACVYGPAFVALSRAVVEIAGASHVFAALESLRLISGFSLLACVILTWRIDQRAGSFIALNPVILWSAIEGHNDTLMLAVVLFGFLVARRYRAVGSAFIAFAALVKLPALAASAGYAAHALIVRRRAAVTLTGSIVGTAIVFAASIPLFVSLDTNVAIHGVYRPLVSVQAIHPLLALALGIGVVAHIGSFQKAIDRWFVLAVALWLAIPNPYPWYTVWLLALAAFAGDSRIRNTAIAISFAALLRYVPDAVATPNVQWNLALGLCALAAYAPLFWPQMRGLRGKNGE